jgi:hypothetical protein
MNGHARPAQEDGAGRGVEGLIVKMSCGAAFDDPDEFVLREQERAEGGGRGIGDNPTVMDTDI